MKKLHYKDFTFCLFTVAFFAVLFFQSSCGIIARLGTPTSHERKIPAEYDLTVRKDQKILVLVNQPSWLNAQLNLRYYITGAMNEELMKKVKLVPESLVSYTELSEFRSKKGDFSLLSPVEVGAALDVDMVLLVLVEGYQLDLMGETGYHKGFLDSRAVLFDTATGEKLWPESEEGKSVRVGFEVEQRSQEVAVARLTAASAHCTVRYLYNCPKNKFKTADDRSHIGWESWKK